jgi:hypothetical protein
LRPDAHLVPATIFSLIGLLHCVIAGLDPAIHLYAKKMDPRVKPAGDGAKGGPTSLDMLEHL